jgi:hypothetical protein
MCPLSVNQNSREVLPFPGSFVLWREQRTRRRTVELASILRPDEKRRDRNMVGISGNDLLKSLCISSKGS